MSLDPEDKKQRFQDAAANIIRKKVSNAYEDEPDFKREVKELDTEKKVLSKHQQYVKELHGSGRTSAEIQSEWHNYYETLPDDEKLEVWDEFYKSSGQGSDFFDKVSKRVQQARGQSKDNGSGTAKVFIAEHVLANPKKSRKHKENHGRKTTIKKMSASARKKYSRHLKSLGFGLVAGTVAIIIFLFSFFNQVFLVPFIQPSSKSVNTPIILSADGLSNLTAPEIIIPKLNLEIPVNYTETSNNESAIEGDLNSGVVHYPSTAFPGENGNSAYFGHSSNNIFNPGKYKFAFVLLHTLAPGDTFYLVYNSKTYVYQVFSRQIVPPSDVSVLNPIAGHNATATLITCDPPGTSINRLVITADQISPSLGGNTTNSSQSSNPYQQSTTLPGNGPSLWSRFIHWL